MTNLNYLYLSTIRSCLSFGFFPTDSIFRRFTLRCIAFKIIPAWMVCFWFLIHIYQMFLSLFLKSLHSLLFPRTWVGQLWKKFSHSNMIYIAYHPEQDSSLELVPLSLCTPVQIVSQEPQAPLLKVSLIKTQWLDGVTFVGKIYT